MRDVTLQSMKNKSNNVVRACQQRVGLFTKISAGYRREAA